MAKKTTKARQQSGLSQKNPVAKNASILQKPQSVNSVALTQSNVLIANQRMNDSFMKRKGSYTPNTVSLKSQAPQLLQRSSSKTDHTAAATTRTQKPAGNAAIKKRINYDSQSQLSASRYQSMQQNERIIKTNALAQNHSNMTQERIIQQLH